ncbi:MAG: UDP-N-acetylglucosamine 1-carboxyvinyltransferase [Desulfobulbaceae bacterium]|nr:UDP-N-acetylglucosamine 1-carboxyvinyltransferase [Desulfobulbaceae bacterium]
MEKIIIQGGKPLYGRVAMSGAKNAALPLIAATLLAPGCHILRNVPDLRDTRTMLKVLEVLGARWERNKSDVKIDTTELSGGEAPYELVKTMRASVLVLGPLIARLGYARVSLPGGCAIGARPIDYHLRGFEQLGVETKLASGYVEAISNSKLSGGVVYFDNPSVTGTENLLMAAVLAQGTTVIKNAAREPEVGNLIDMLLGMGACIEGKDSDCLTVQGVKGLQPADAVIIPDRIETGTYVLAVAAAGGEVTITNCNPNHLPSLLEKVRDVGVEVEEGESEIRIKASVRREGSAQSLRSVNIRTMPYPGFPTDLQAQFMALMMVAEGVSIIHETIFENRFMHVAELQRMGAMVDIDGGTAVVKGLGEIVPCGAQVMATDLRASASLVIAGLAANGMTEITRIYHLERGYENMVEKLLALGADIRKVQE